MKSTSYNNIHVAVIMDGNGRWATARGLPRIAGHRAGADAVSRTVEAARELGIGALTLYAFSSDNWKRPPEEVSGLMQLFRAHLEAEKPRCIQHGIRLEVIGRRDRLVPALAATIEETERETSRGRALHLRIAVDYSARDAILRAASRLDSRFDVTRERFARLLGQAPDVDLMIRTGGEQRLSDFLLWESAYAELVFTPCMWPEFARENLESALLEFSRRHRRFGALPAPNGKTVIPADVL
jgi:undecaprenyl diphosphate synthase